MKRYYLLIILLVFSLALFSETKVQINLGFDTAGKLTSLQSGQDPVNVNMGYTPSLEFLVPVMPSVLIGPGVGYQLARSFNETGISDKRKFGFVPVYLAGKFGLFSFLGIKTELAANVGYSFYTGTKEYKTDGKADLTGGLAWGIGAGIYLPVGVTGQVMYQNFNGSYKLSSLNIDAKHTYKTLSFILGLRF